ncbi:hypothetical protein [Rugosimonospora africana]|uniref:Ferritin-like domain-containing protein n=1 Tax=Rugosimonospora africana TaxID=556532 RepID=A0A8J3VTU2_9ACTN|nr:hypothetical protein [Rugosimonospora africana]GIH17908.1 hypothetical protein Raf01_60800 [Rugosimonospora africana]
MAFDTDTYARTVSPVGFDDLDYASFTERPLSAGALRCLRYMCDIENHTVCYLRDLLVTPSHADPEVTTFLTMWAYEEYWHGEALARVLAAHGIPTGDGHIRQVREGLGWRDRLTPVGTSLIANLIGADFVAVHMTWGAINEWSTHAGYARLAELEDHPVLTRLLDRIMRQETRHVAFYASQARERLRGSAHARRLTRFALRRFWAPVGAGVMPRAETGHLMRFLLGDARGRMLATQIDEKIDRLPGLAGLGLVRRASSSYAVA